MFGGDRDLDTICAISTPPGTGGIHVLRICGSNSSRIVRSLAPFLPEKLESHRVYFGTLIENSLNLEAVDEVLVTYFGKGRSYTGEETIEISCHGSSFIASQILKGLVVAGARIADRGEFTYRAFLNGRIDLVQAESVLALIEAESKKANQIALAQLKGGLSIELEHIKSEIVALLARLEISIDFTTEDIEIISKEETRERSNRVLSLIQKLLGTFRWGTKVRSGFEVVLVGEPNVGKSSLLNVILGEEKAIVTDVPGTTRDLVQDYILVKGVKVAITDSAGIRETSDLVEKIGVSRSKGAVERADLVLIVYDLCNPRIGELVSELKLDYRKVVFVGNKIDLVENAAFEKWKNGFQKFVSSLEKFQNVGLDEINWDDRSIFISAVDVESRNKVLEIVERLLDVGHFEDGAVVSNTRHYECLQRAFECLTRAVDLAELGSSPEFLALEVKESLIKIQEILGERFDDQILDRVFSEFCIGK